MREESRPLQINENIRDFLKLMEAASEARVMSRSSKIRAVADMVCNSMKKLNFESIDFYDQFLQIKHQWNDALKSRGYL